VTTLRVLHLFTTIGAGGTERQTFQLVRLLRESALCEVEVASLSPSGPMLAELEAAGYASVTAYPLRRLADARTAAQILRFARHLRRERIDVLHTHDFYTNVFGMLAGVLARVPVRICSRRELDVFSPAQRRLDHLAYRLAGIVVANCETLYLQLLQEGVPPARAAVIPNGLDPLRVRPQPFRTRADLLQRLGLPRDGQVVTMIANLHNPKKDPVTFLEAAQVVAAGHRRAVFVIAGAGRAPAAVVSSAESLTDAGRFVLFHATTQIGDLLAATDVSVLSSYSEGMPNALLEAMAAGCAVVATDVGGVREAVQDGVTGYVVPAGDAAMMADRIGILLGDHGKAIEFGRRARASVTTRFSQAAQLRQTLELYGMLLSASGTRNVWPPTQAAT
jgi:L-malate glycosyltransferase